MHPSELILVLDFGAQYSQLIARRVRELGVYSELRAFNVSVDEIRKAAPAGIILSGGPSSVYDEGAPLPDPAILDLGIPVLGICYGLQVIAHQRGGAVDPGARREFGRADLVVEDPSGIFAGFNGGATPVWMSHGDALSRLPQGFRKMARSGNSPIGAIGDAGNRIYGVQFHPEVVHTPRGMDILRNFAFGVCGCKGGWDSGSIIRMKTEEIRAAVGDEKVLCALSGGVDSSVLAVLLHEAIGDRLHCIHINNGVMRKGESEQIVSLYRDHYRFNLKYLDATDEFLSALSGVEDPEQKRKTIGRVFIDVFEREAAGLGGVNFLAQGTLYPDVIESTSFRGPSHTIKSHHNVGGLPERMRLKLVEPFRELFKDEVRAIGRSLGLPDHFVGRHPFPGPGLAVRIIGGITRERLEILRKADDIFVEEIRNRGWYDKLWQAFAVLLPVKSVGVMGDMRTYENVAALRAVHSTDGMTADWAPLPAELLSAASSRIVNEVRGINRVVYDISSKPPSTIEWE